MKRMNLKELTVFIKGKYGINQTELAEAVGVTQGRFSTIVTSDATVSVLTKILEATGENPILITKEKQKALAEIHGGVKISDIKQMLISLGHDLLIQLGDEKFILTA